jgi:hypothetical protein
MISWRKQKMDKTQKKVILWVWLRILGMGVIAACYLVIVLTYVFAFWHGQDQIIMFNNYGEMILEFVLLIIGGVAFLLSILWKPTIS